MNGFFEVESCPFARVYGVSVEVRNRSRRYDIFVGMLLRPSTSICSLGAAHFADTSDLVEVGSKGTCHV